jgi:aminomuconate-semialdehyde/2-hydroxymuconate-6-semialdehyde dehydrogenase
MEPLSGRYLDNIEPATGKPYSQVADSRHARDVELAVAAAEKAFARLAACQVKAAMEFLHSVTDEGGALAFDLAAAALSALLLVLVLALATQ